MVALKTTDFDQQYVELSHGRTRFLTAGTGAPLLLLHGVGYTGGGDLWLLNIGPLAEKFRVIAPDFLGWGLGDRLNVEYSFAYLVDFVRELQDALDIEKSHIVGHSMGGWVSSVFAYESPNRVDKLVLIGSGGTRTRTIPEMTEFQAPDREGILRSLKQNFGENTVDLEQMADEAVAKTQVPGALESYRGILKHMNTAGNRSRYNTLRRLAKVKAPTMLVWGDRDEVNNVEMAHATKEVMPHARLEILPDTGHMVPMQRPAELNALLLDFLGS
jgi:pimeloyl-ACP methyl ester carboxylesterase